MVVCFVFVSVCLMSSVFALSFQFSDLMKKMFGDRINENVKQTTGLTIKNFASNSCLPGKTLKTVCTKSEPPVCYSSCEKIPIVCGNGKCEKGEKKRDVTHELSVDEINYEEFNTAPFCVKDCGYRVRGV